LLLFALGTSPLLGCGSSTTPSGGAGGSGGAAAASGQRDVRVTVPKEDPAYLQFVSTEEVVPPGEERMFCTHFSYTGPDIAFDLQSTKQGKFGHHAVLLGAKEPLPNGTGEDCSKKEDMSKYDAYTISDQELPAGYGTLLRSGRKLVLQAHYINTGDAPLLIRDVVQLRKVPVDQVKNWAAIYVINSLEHRIPAMQTGSRSVDCTIADDVKLLVVGGHMHEFGSKISLDSGPDVDHLKSVFVTDNWKPEYRDSPPIHLFFDNPMQLLKGTVMRTNCEWKNPTDHEITFPEEMCDAFGFVAGTQDPVVCSL
jgi:hypothetical protein